MSLDPGIYSQVQTSLLSTLNGVLTASIGYSQSLLYLTAGIEVVLFALLWMLQGNNAFGRLIVTVLKIGFILMVINQFNAWLSELLDSFYQISANASNVKEAFQLLEAPGQIWQYGYNSAILLLKTASNDGLSVGLSLLLTTLGLGILLVFGLIGARLVVQLAAFYVTALIALLFLPLGVLKPTADFAYRGLQSVLKSGVALLTIILVLTVAMSIWQGHALAADFNLNQVLGIFFSGLIFLMMTQWLPGIAASAVGHIRPLAWDAVPSVTVSPQAATEQAQQMRDAMRAAVSLDASSGAAAGGAMASAVHISPASSPASMAPALQRQSDKQDRQRFGAATEVSISRQTLSKLKSTQQASGE